MDQLKNLVKHGMISIQQMEGEYGLLFEPDLRRCQSFKLTTILIKRQQLDEACKALELYLHDPFRGADDYPVSFFDPDSQLSDYYD